MPSTLIVGELIHTLNLSKYSYSRTGTPKNDDLFGFRAVMSAGSSSPPVGPATMDYINMSSSGNASDFGDLTTTTSSNAACSGDAS